MKCTYDLKAQTVKNVHHAHAEKSSVFLTKLKENPEICKQIQK